MTKGLSTSMYAASMGPHQQNTDFNTADVTTKYNLGGMRGAGLLIVYAAQIALMIDQVNLAEDYYRTNKKDHDHWDTTYRPRMAAMRAELYAEPRPVFDRFMSPFCYKQSGAAGSRVVDARWQDTMRQTNRYATGHHIAATQDFALVRHNAAVAGYNTGAQLARHKVDTYDDRRHMRRLAILNIGISAGNTAKTGLASSVGSLINAQNQLGSAVGAFGNGLARQSGYVQGRESTREQMRN